MKTVLSTQKLAIGYKRIPLLTDLDLQLLEGTVTAILGRNGAGKSTLIKTLGRHISPIGGQIFLKGKDLATFTRKELSKVISIISTDANSAAGLKLEELVGLGRIPYTGTMGILTNIDKDIIERTINDVGIEHKRGCYVSELSDGERQKALLASGLVQETPVLILDEPFSFLDVASRLEMLGLMKRLAKETNKSILFSTHEVSEALRAVDCAWAFIKEDGKEKIIQGTPAELIEWGTVNKIFPDSKVKFNRSTVEYTF